MTTNSATDNFTEKIEEYKKNFVSLYTSGADGNEEPEIKDLG